MAYILNPKKSTFSVYQWVGLFKKYILKKSDFSKIFETISLKMLEMLLKNRYVKLPHIGILEVRIRKEKKPSLYNDKAYFFYPRSELIFHPDKTFRDIFDKKFLTTYELKEIEDGTFDWIKKSESKVKLQKRIA